MDFLVIIIVLPLLHYWKLGTPLHSDQWFESLYQTLGKPVVIERNAGVHLFLALAMPCLALGVVYYWLDDRLFGLPKLILMVFLLLYCMGRGDFEQTVENYMNAWREGDAVQALQQLQLVEELGHGGINLREIHYAARSNIFYSGFERTFAVIFWFIILGPIAALFYRLTQIHFDRVAERGDARGRFAATLLYFLDCLPARLLCASFSLVGDFVKCLNACAKTLFDRSLSAAQVLEYNGLAALGVGVDETDALETGAIVSMDEAHEFMLAAADEIASILALFSRTLILWVVGLAFVQLLF